MHTKSLTVVPGRHTAPSPRRGLANVQQSIQRAIDAGYRIGCVVFIGRVPGSVIGYNISSFGRFSGASYPLLVETAYGTAKCSMREVCPA